MVLARQIVACPSCKARFDVSAYKPGSKIRCGSCYKILLIPARKADSGEAAPAPAPAPRAEPPARQAPVPAKKRRLAPAKSAPTPPRKPVQKKAPAKRAAPPAAKASRTAEQTPPAAKPKPQPKPVPQPEPRPAPKPPPKPAQDPLIGKKINNEFELIGVLGQGGYGTVYEAMDLALKRRVALKLMLQEKTTNKEFVDKFLREARTAAMLSHPNIVRIHLVGFSKELQQHFLAMEYVEGETLSDIMKRDGAVPADRAVEIMLQAANGLAEAHRKNIIHRDIKPGNVMITPKGVVKIADFGLAKVYDPDAAASMVIGTPYFMPPEQFEGKARDGRTDIYALGVTFYYILTLKRPFDGRTPAEVLMNVLRSDPVPPMEHNPDVPEGLWPILRRMIARNLDDRYPTCEELARDLRDFQSGAETEEKIFCVSCGFANSFTAKTCLECGLSLLEPCPSCGTPDVVGAKFCGSCGANLEKEKQVAGLLSEAESHVASGRLELALEKFNSAKDLSPEKSEVVEGLRRVEEAVGERDRLVRSIEELVEDGSFLEALPLAEEAAERFPGHEPIAQIQHRVLGGAKGARLEAAIEEAQILLRSGDLYDACSAARRALDVDPDSDQARELLKEAEKALEDHVAARDRATELEKQHRLPEALDSWQTALSILPGDEAAAQAVTRIEGILGQLERLRNRAAAALEGLELQKARSSLEDAVGVLPCDPATLELLDRLRGKEEDVERRFIEGLELILEGSFADGSASLESLAAEYKQAPFVADAAEMARELLKVALFFRDSSEELLKAGHPRIAGRFARVARGIAPGDENIGELLSQANRAREDLEKKIEQAEALLAAEDYDGAIALLTELGGVAAPHRAVGELASKAGNGLREAETSERNQTHNIVDTALQTSRELLQAGRFQAAQAACRKALRTDPGHDGALSLQAEIEAALTKDGHTTRDTRIETAFFEFKDLEAE
jgi:serine/threonine protein kinase/tetratricopeptide (TPR) repeat protein